MLSKLFQCQDCGSFDGYRSRPRNFSEKYLLPLVLLLPVRCADCGCATLFASDCRLCGAALVKIARLAVCDEGVAQMRPITGSVCSVCGERLASPFAAAGERCGLGRRAAPPVAKAAAYGSYDGGLRELIHLLKYEQVRPAAGALGGMLAEAISTLA